MTFEVLAALADVDGDGDHLGTGGLGDPADADGGVQAAGVGEDDALSHGSSSGVRGVRGSVCRSRARSGVRSCVGGQREEAGGEGCLRPVSPSRAITRTVSSPAIVPRTAGRTEWSMAEREELGGARRGAQHDEVARRLRGDQQLGAQPGEPGGEHLLVGTRRRRVRPPPSAGTA